MLSIAATSLPAFTAPLLPHATRVAAPVMKAEGEIGVTPPLGVWDPLGCLAEPVDYPRRDYRRYVELEIKHGRIAMLATVGVLTTEAGFRWPGYLSKSLDLKFADLPGARRPAGAGERGLSGQGERGPRNAEAHTPPPRPPPRRIGPFPQRPPPTRRLPCPA